MINLCKNKTINKWNHLITRHKPDGYNPHGTFKKVLSKGTACMIDIYLHTSCGLFYTHAHRCELGKNCETLQKMNDYSRNSYGDGCEDIVPLEYLSLLYNSGYIFVGWEKLEYRDQSEHNCKECSGVAELKTTNNKPRSEKHIIEHDPNIEPLAKRVKYY